MRRTRGKLAAERGLGVERRLVKKDHLRSRRHAMTVPRTVPIYGRGRTSLRGCFLIRVSAENLARLRLSRLTKWDESDGLRDLATTM